MSSSKAEISKRSSPGKHKPSKASPPVSRRRAARAKSRHLIVGIGASVGGLDGFRAFLRCMPPGSGMSFVLVQHLSPEHESMLPELLRSSSTMPVLEAVDGTRVLPDHVYVIPPDATLRVTGGYLRLSKPEAARGHRLPIDALFSSLAADQGENAVCIILSGGGSDGTEGLRAIKEYGGLSMAQAKFDHQPLGGMPTSATGTGLVDYVLKIEKMPAKLLAYAQHLQAVPRDPAGNVDADVSSHLAMICGMVRDAVGHDFSHYKSKTLMRRIQRRMQVLQVASTAAYIERLREDPGEVRCLFEDFLIGVTHFFRDPAAFDALQEKVILPLVRQKEGKDTIRVWVPACATGQEAYSIAILLREAAERTWMHAECQVFATDIDEQAIAVARAARYPMAGAVDIPPARFERWFATSGDHFSPVKEVREMCIFSTHSVLKDPPFSRLDLISCRNLMIYFDGDLQDRILRTFHYSLRTDGFLFLGNSENVARQPKLFTQIDMAHRLYRRRKAQVYLPTLPATPVARPQAIPVAAPLAATEKPFDVAIRTLMEKRLPAFIVVDGNNDIVRFSGATDRYLGPTPGVANLNLFSLLRRGLRTPARTLLSKARKNGAEASYQHAPLDLAGSAQAVDLVVEPLPPAADGLCILMFIERAPNVAPAADGSAPRSVETQSIARELAETRKRLEAAIDQFESSNQELKSANEEYQAVNEELQSANEELETSKEELQSVNEELQTVNAEMISKSNRLQEVNNDLRNLLDNAQIATLFLDRQFRIRSFTPAMTKLLHLRESDQGRPVTDLVSQLAYDEMAEDAARVQKELQLVEREVRVKNGDAWYMVRLRPYRTSDNVIDGVVITCVDITDSRKAADLRQHLIDELNHRVRNTLASVQAIVTRTLASNADAESVRLLNARLDSLARTHTLLADSQWTTTSLRKLLEQEFAPYQEASQRIDLGGADLDLTPAASLVLGMAFHELATNAAKYGALSNRNGKVTIRWGVTKAAGSAFLRLKWKEAGGPKVIDTKYRGFGSSVIERAVVYELSGTVQAEFLPAGLTVTITLPLNTIAPSM